MVITKKGLLESNVIAGTTLLNVYINVASRGDTQYVQKTSITLILGYVWTALISGYADNGWVFYLEEACIVFSKQHNRDVVSYNAMNSGYMRNNKGFSALKSLSSRYV